MKCIVPMSRRCLDLHAKVKVRIKEVMFDENGEKVISRKRYDTTAGRALLSNILPDGLPFSLVNREMNKKAISALINTAYRTLGLKNTVVFADKLMYTGFAYSTRAGVSIGIR
jgi:DNA-directed RNA polymerase subunit beta'